MYLGESGRPGWEGGGGDWRNGEKERVKKGNWEGIRKERQKNYDKRLGYNVLEKA